MKIDFYILSEPVSGRAEQFACKLTDKIYHLNLRIYIHTDSVEHAKIVDDLLWTFNQGSFLPHDIDDYSGTQDSPILIGYLDQLGGKYDVLVNLSQSVPEFFGQFERIAEIVEATENTKILGRERFRFYQRHGFEIDTHHIDS